MRTSPPKPTMLDRQLPSPRLASGDGSRPARVSLNAARSAAGGGGSGNEYPGGKSADGTWQWILGHLPEHVYYAEPFAGKAAIARHKPPALATYLIDVDREVLHWLAARSLPGATVQFGDGIRWLELAAEWLDRQTLVYCDPPYLLSTRVKQRLYVSELSVADHVRLLTAVKRCRCRVAISGYPSPLYESHLAGWSRHERDVVTRGGTLRTEVLWLNYSLQDAWSPLTVEYSRLGADYRERERRARKIARWTARLEAMPAIERHNLLLSLLAMRRRPSSVPALRPSVLTIRDPRATRGRSREKVRQAVRPVKGRRRHFN